MQWRTSTRQQVKISLIRIAKWGSHYCVVCSLNGHMIFNDINKVDVCCASVLFHSLDMHTQSICVWRQKQAFQSERSFNDSFFFPLFFFGAFSNMLIIEKKVSTEKQKGTK